METYLVGGAVRDQLLGLPIKDRDWVVVGATQEQMIEQGYRQVGRDFPVFIHPDSGEEYALARTERKSGHGYTGFTVYASPEVSLEDDLKRRDLTINAIAQDQSGKLYDPFRGKADIEQRVLRHVSDAFSEDPLRLLRLARFYARFNRFGFKVHKTTSCLLHTIVANKELQALVPERVWQEIDSALSCENPQAFFSCLQEHGAFAVLFPELVANSDITIVSEQRPKAFEPGLKAFDHELKAFDHGLKALKNAAENHYDNETRWSVLLYSLVVAQKAEVEAFGASEKNASADDRKQLLITNLCERYKTPTSFRQTALHLARLHKYIVLQPDLDAESICYLFEALDLLRRPIQLVRFRHACIALAYVPNPAFTLNRGISWADIDSLLQRCAKAYAQIDTRKISAATIASFSERERDSASGGIKAQEISKGEAIALAIKNARRMAVEKASVSADI